MTAPYAAIRGRIFVDNRTGGRTFTPKRAIGWRIGATSRARGVAMYTRVDYADAA